MGALTLERDGTEVQLSGRMPRTLLALLLMNPGRPRTVDQLIEGLWPVDPPASASSAIHVHLSKVRALLGDLVVRSPAGYALQAGGYELDADAFEQLLERASRERDGARDLLTQALGLWREVPLSDLQPDGGPLADWCRALLESRLRATMMRIDCDLAAGDGANLLAELEPLVAANPFEEQLWRQLMHALYRAGRQAEALSAYDRARRLFATELGLEPGEQLKQLQSQILNQDPSLLPTAEPAWDLAAPSQRRRSAIRLTLPQPTTRLIGRGVALLELDRLTSDPFCRLVTLTGMGGVGKTRLAIAHAARWGQTFADGVVFVGLARLTDAPQVRAEIASAIARRSDSLEPNELTLVRYLAGRELLLVLDNFEHVLDAADVVAELLEASVGLKVLVTSRIALRLRGEQRFVVEPLDTDVSGDSTTGPAVELFLQGACALDRTFEPNAQEMVTIAEICRALDGLPLAIELAAARSLTLSPAQIAAQLKTPLTIGRGELRDLPERHQTLEAAIRWSYDLLSTPAQQVLRAASAFVGPFTPDGLSAVAGGDATDALHELTDASLVQRSSVPDRFRLLDLVRTFALARLTGAGEADQARIRHRQYLATRFADVAAEEYPSTPGAVALEMAPDHADIRMAITDAVAAGDGHTAVTLAKALHSIWWVAQLEESGTTVDAILAAFTLSPEDELRLLRMADDANGYRPTNDYWSRRRATRAAELGDLRSQVGALGRLAVHAFNRRDTGAAIEVRTELRRVLDENPTLSPRSRGVALTAMGDCAYLEGDYAAAAALSTEAVGLALAAGIPQMVAARRGLQLVANSAHTGWIASAALREMIEGALELGLPDIAVNTLLPAARYAAAFDPELARLWLANAERVIIEIGGEMGNDWQDETLPILGVEDMSTLLDSVPRRPILELLAEARDWLATRDPDERAPRAVPARPAAAGRAGTVANP